MTLPMRRSADVPVDLGGERETTPDAWTVETVTLRSDAAARLKKGSCKVMTLPMRRSADGAPTLPCETSARRRVKRVPGFTGAFAPC